MFKGSCVALVTPFKNGKLDEKRLRELVAFHVANGTSALVPCGTTGESATLSHSEHNRVIEIVAREAKGKIPVIAGTGSNSTEEAIHLTAHAKKMGVDAALIIAPYYNKPTQAGLFAHFSKLAKHVNLPLIIYNIPSRTGVNILPATLVELAKKHSNIVGVKESSGSLEQVTEIIRGTSGLKNFSLLSGDDALTLPILSVGGSGVISVLANIAPREVAMLCESALEGNLKIARHLHLKQHPLIKALFIETNPAPIKTAMEMLGMIQSELRLPMVPLSEPNKKKLAEELTRFGLKRDILRK